MDDLDWLVQLGVDSAISLGDGFDTDAMVQWYTHFITSPAVISIRGSHSAGFALCSPLYFNPAMALCQLQLLLSRPSQTGRLEAYRVLREIDARRKAMKCRRFYILSTGNDLTPFAERMGARRVGSVHLLEDAA